MSSGRNQPAPARRTATAIALSAAAVIVVGALVFLVVSIRRDAPATDRSPLPPGPTTGAPEREASASPAPPAPARPTLPPPTEPAPAPDDVADPDDPPDPAAVTLRGLTPEQELAQRRSEQASMERAIAGLREQISSSSADDPERRQLERQLESLERLAAERRAELERLERADDDAP